STQVVVEIEAIAPSADEDLCAAWSLTDEFDADSRRWYASSQLPGCAVSVDQGALVIEQDNVDRCGIESAEHFDLTGSSFAVEVVDAGDCDLAPYLTVLLSGLYPEIGCVQSEGAPVLVVQMFGDGEAPDLLASIPYDSDLHRFWRIRHDGDGGQLVFETRRDSGEWDDLVSTPIDDELVRGAGVALEAADDSPDGTGEPVVFDHFNLVP
ncbi:MAG TPA: hypothetical protein VFU21_10940, partial [Kofleriaceae bacterium]|nr:hypothetical protein [Kofleriaceae bacterium]